MSRVGFYERGVQSIECRVGRVDVSVRDERHEDGHRDLRCEARLEADPPRRSRAAFERLAKQSDPIGRTAMSDMPESFRAFSEEVLDELRGALDRVVGVLRWRVGGDVPVLADLGRAPLRWSPNGEDWYGFPTTTSVQLGWWLHLDVRPNAAKEIDVLIDRGLSEPFGYELLREATALHTRNPRSSLMIAITALEVAVKQYVADRAPESQWLVNESPAPDVVKMLIEYLPTLEPPANSLTGAARFKSLSPELLELLRKRRDQRNQIAHRPEAHQRRQAPIATPERALSAILSVRQVLLRLDVADGHLWARQFLGEPPYEPPPFGVRTV